MATPRGHIVDDEAVGTYHCISRCVRKAMLCGEGLEHRRTWIENRIADLQGAMAIDLTAWHVMANHMHLVVTTRPDIVREWSDREVAERHLRMCPGRWRRRRKGIPVDQPPTSDEIAEITGSPDRIKTLRRRLSCLSWFMAKLKEHVARLSNLEDGCTGHFWEGRFRSVKVLDRPSLLATSTYVDLNSVRAGVVDRPEDSSHGSISERVAMLMGLPRRTRIRLDHAPHEDEATYLSHVDAWGRVVIGGKRATRESLPPILKRLKISKRRWIELLRANWDRFRGTAIGTPESKRREVERRGGRWLIDPLAG